MKTDSAIVAFVLLVSSVAGTAFAGDPGYIEFLWAPSAEAALARGEAFGFVLDGKRDHQVCVGAVDARPRHGVLRVDVVDAAGDVVQSRHHAHFDGQKACYPAD